MKAEENIGKIGSIGLRCLLEHTMPIPKYVKFGLGYTRVTITPPFRKQNGN